MECNKSNGVPPSSYNHVSHTAEIPIDYYQLLKNLTKKKNAGFPKTKSYYFPTIKYNHLSEYYNTLCQSSVGKVIDVSFKHIL